MMDSSVECNRMQQTRPDADDEIVVSITLTDYVIGAVAGVVLLSILLFID